MKVHLEKTERETVCGGRISGVKSTGRKQFFAYKMESFLKVAVKDRCVKCESYLNSTHKG